MGSGQRKKCDKNEEKGKNTKKKQRSDLKWAVMGERGGME